MGKSERKAKKKHKSKHREHKEKSKKSKRHSKHKQIKEEPKPAETAVSAAVVNERVMEEEEEEDFAIPIALMNNKSYAPETPDEYQRRQSQIRREVDPVTGRIRLIKGDSEILEEIVSRDRHRDINRKATQGDGDYYESQSLGKAKAKRK